MFSRQCNQIHQKREEMADKIQEISGETQQLKAKMKSLRDVCSKETEKAQVSDQEPPPYEHLHSSWLTCLHAGAVRHAVHLHGGAAQEDRGAHRRAEAERHQHLCRFLTVSFVSVYLSCSLYLSTCILFQKCFNKLIIKAWCGFSKISPLTSKV